jgi:hypothetical protein
MKIALKPTLPFSFSIGPIVYQIQPGEISVLNGPSRYVIAAVNVPPAIPPMAVLALSEVFGSKHEVPYAWKNGFEVPQYSVDQIITAMVDTLVADGRAVEVK